jgi:putative oxidoreductase
VLTIAAVVIGLAFNGAGAWSVDAALGLDLNGVVWGLGAAGAALIGFVGVLAVFRGRVVGTVDPEPNVA